MESRYPLLTVLNARRRRRHGAPIDKCLAEQRALLDSKPGTGEHVAYIAVALTCNSVNEGAVEYGDASMYEYQRGRSEVQ